jgi:hypothetical protein
MPLALSLSQPARPRRGYSTVKHPTRHDAFGSWASAPRRISARYSYGVRLSKRQTSYTSTRPCRIQDDLDPHGHGRRAANIATLLRYCVRQAAERSVVSRIVVRSPRHGPNLRLLISLPGQRRSSEDSPCTARFPCPKPSVQLRKGDLKPSTQLLTVSPCWP